jgi:WD40 repeat protein
VFVVTVTGSIVQSFEGHARECIPCLCLTPDQRRLVTGGSDGLAKLWDCARPANAPVLSVTAIPAYELTWCCIQGLCTNNSEGTVRSAELVASGADRSWRGGMNHPCQSTEGQGGGESEKV